MTHPERRFARTHHTEGASGQTYAEWIRSDKHQVHPHKAGITVNK